MTRRAAIVTQAEVARVIRAAKQAGAAEVEARPDGSLIIRLHPSPQSTDAPVDDPREVIL